MSVLTRLKKYSRAVVDDRIVVGRWHKMACQRFLSDLERDDVYFDEDYADKCRQLWEGLCCYPKGSLMGRPISLTDFQAFVLYNLMCWRKKGGSRRFKTAYIQLARKSTKTFMMALAILSHLILDPFPAPYIPVGANDEQQAKLCVDMVGKIIEKSPSLNAIRNIKGVRTGQPFTLYKYKDKYTQVVYQTKDKDGAVEAITSKSETKDGSEPTMGIIDEYHAAVNDNIREVIKTGQMMIEERMLYTITTAGFNKEGPCYSSLRDMAVKNIEGSVENDENFVLICEPDEEDDWTKEDTWRKSNPMFDEVPAIAENLRHDFKDALEKGGSTEVHFKTKNLNIWTNSESIWVRDEDWLACEREYSIDEFTGVHFDGLDLAKSKDLNAHVMLSSRMETCHYCNGMLKMKDNEGKIIPCSPCTPQDETKPSGKLRHYYIFPNFWIPQDKILTHSDGVDYHKWIQDGYVYATPGNVVDHRWVTNFIYDTLKIRDLKSLGYDRAYAYHGVAQELLEMNVPINEVPQKADKRSTTIKYLEQLIEQRRIHHNGNPVMRWMLSNIVLFETVEMDYKFDKGKSKGKIDGWDALVNALFEAMRVGWEEESVNSLIG